jgi:Glucodextranase, domain B
LRILLDGRNVTPFCFVRATAASCEEVFIEDGRHTIEVFLSDTAGNMVTASRQVLLDTTPPRITVDAFPAGTVTTTASITITGTINDSWADPVGSGPVQVTVNGLVAQVTAGRFVVEAVPLLLGRNTMTVVAVDGAGNTATMAVAVIFRDPNAFITLEILSPSEEALLASPEVTVHGTITNTTGYETGVTINGVVALVYDGQFVANQVPLQEGENILTVLATDSAGNTASAFMTLYREATGGYISLTANTYAGFAPLETILRIEGSVPITASTLTVTGPETAEVVPGFEATDYMVRLTAAGLYVVTAEASDEDGNQYTHTLALLVRERTVLDTALRAKWDGMKQALANQNTPAAVNFFSDETKGLYQEIFTLLSPQLPQLVQEMQNIELVWAEDQTAQYRIRRHEQYGGQPLTVTYYIYFRVDGDGLWKILRY